MIGIKFRSLIIDFLLNFFEWLFHIKLNRFYGRILNFSLYLDWENRSSNSVAELRWCAMDEHGPSAAKVSQLNQLISGVIASNYFH